MCLYALACVQMCVFVRMYVYECVCVCVCVSVCVRCNLKYLDVSCDFVIFERHFSSTNHK